MTPMCGLDAAFEMRVACFFIVADLGGLRCTFSA
jgi:hypothetical protein